MVTYLLENEIFRFLELQFPFSGDMGCSYVPIYQWGVHISICLCLKYLLPIDMQVIRTIGVLIFQ